MNCTLLIPLLFLASSVFATDQKFLLKSSSSELSQTIPLTPPNSTKPRTAQEIRFLDTIDMILDKATTDEQQRASLAAELKQLSPAALQQRWQAERQEMIESFQLPVQLAPLLEKVHFNQLLSIYRKRNPTMFDVKQALGFLADPHLLAGFEESLLRRRLIEDIRGLLHTGVIAKVSLKHNDKLRNLLSFSTHHLAVLRKALKACRDEASAERVFCLYMDPEGKEVKSENADDDLAELRMEIAGGRDPLTLSVFSVLAGLTITLAALICFKDVKYNDDEDSITWTVPSSKDII